MIYLEFIKFGLGLDLKITLDIPFFILCSWIDPSINKDNIFLSIIYKKIPTTITSPRLYTLREYIIIIMFNK